MADPAIYLQGVRKTFRSGLRRRNVVAVDHLDLTIQQGSVVAFVGPNGAGKTTTIHMLLGLLRPDGGQIRLFGEPPGSVQARRRVGFMSEIFHTYPFHTARGAITFYGRLSGTATREMEGSIPEHLTRVGLGRAVDRKVGTFSKGMTQRLGLAQALFHQPELLLLDEPTTGLDPEGRRLVAEIIAEEQARGTTVFLSSHILSDVEKSCDTVVMIREGKVVFSELLSVLTARSEEWEVEVRGIGPGGKEALVGEGFPVLREEDGATFLGCASVRKKELLQRLIESPWEIGGVANRGQSLEDLYMKHVGHS